MKIHSGLHEKRVATNLPSIWVRNCGICPEMTSYTCSASSTQGRDWSPSREHRGLSAKFLESHGLWEGEEYIRRYTEYIKRARCLRSP